MTIWLQSCSIAEEAVEAAISHCNMLETLDIRFCAKVRADPICVVLEADVKYLFYVHTECFQLQKQNYDENVGAMTLWWSLLLDGKIGIKRNEGQ